jgi:hypothetical protein
MRKRHGFTLVEMLVSTALVIFIMVILTQAFSTGMDAFRQLNTIGDMQEKLRSAGTIMAKDLAANHFDDSRKISDTALFTNGPPLGGFFRIWHGSPLTLNSDGLSNPYNNVYEGTDGDGIESYRVVDHLLHFTVRRTGTHREDFASANVPVPANAALPLGLPALGKAGSRFQDGGNTYNYQYYEVAYFLSPSNYPNAADVTSSGIRRYTLIRRQRLVVPHPDLATGIDVNSAASAIPVAAGYGEVSCRPTPGAPANFYFNDQTDLTVPQRRFGMVQTAGAGGDGGVPLLNNTAPFAPPYYPLISDKDTTTNAGDPLKAGSDILLTDVLSFQVMVLPGGANTTTNGTIPNKFVDLYDTTSLPASQNTNFQGAASPRVFDTWSNKPDPTYTGYSSSWTAASGWNTVASATTLPLNTNILALQITLRIWDVKTQTTRQLTFVQNM